MKHGLTYIPGAGEFGLLIRLTSMVSRSVPDDER